uniref:Uncharacterized protein n=1 Tax=Arion vulgaris TaxID=1028688 RepID=A0A0B7B2I6_9EUPU
MEIRMNMSVMFVVSLHSFGRNSRAVHDLTCNVVVNLYCSYILTKSNQPSQLVLLNTEE